MKRRWWRLGLRVGACLGAGVVVTVLVAWGFAVWAPESRTASSAGGAWPIDVPEEWPAAERSFHGVSLGLRMSYSFAFDDSGTIVQAYTTEAGWPLPALGGDLLHFRTADATRFGVIRERGFKLPARRDAFFARQLPTRPVWIGLTANTLLFGTLIFVGWVFATAGRSRVWRGRGACVQCGYHLRGLGSGSCPECGMSVVERER